MNGLFSRVLSYTQSIASYIHGGRWEIPGLALRDRANARPIRGVSIYVASSQRHPTMSGVYHTHVCPQCPYVRTLAWICVRCCDTWRRRQKREREEERDRCGLSVWHFLVENTFPATIHDSQCRTKICYVKVSGLVMGVLSEHQQRKFSFLSRVFKLRTMWLVRIVQEQHDRTFALAFFSPVSTSRVGTDTTLWYSLSAAIRPLARKLACLFFKSCVDLFWESSDFFRTRFSEEKLLFLLQHPVAQRQDLALVFVVAKEICKLSLVVFK